MVWVDSGLQKQIAGIAAAESSTTSAVAERLFIAGINALAEPARPAEPVDAHPAHPADTGAFNRDLGAFKLAVVELWNAGTRGYGPIATALEAGGYRNSNGNPYNREAVRCTLMKAGLVTKAKKENTLDH